MHGFIYCWLIAGNPSGFSHLNLKYITEQDGVTGKLVRLQDGLWLDSITWEAKILLLTSVIHYYDAIVCEQMKSSESAASFFLEKIFLVIGLLKMWNLTKYHRSLTVIYAMAWMSNYNTVVLIDYSEHAIISVKGPIYFVLYGRSDPAS